MPKYRTIQRYLTAIALLLGLLSTTLASAKDWQVDKTAKLENSPTGIVAVEGVRLSVRNLDAMLDFYQSASGFQVLQRGRIEASPATAALFGQTGGHDFAILESPTMRLELVQFDGAAQKSLPKLPVYGPGMTHTCYQSKSVDGVYRKFVDAGAKVISRGDEPVDLAGYGVRYAYALDPEGNMLELEEVEPERLQQSGYDSNWKARDAVVWMTQVALVTHDLDRLTGFYADLLGINPYRNGKYSGNPRFDDVVDIDGLALQAAWFRMDDRNKVIEIWQYDSPQTPAKSAPSQPTDLGYSFTLIVRNLEAEVKRLQKSGVRFVSAPQQVGDALMVFAWDIDGNVFALKQNLSARPA